MNDIIKQQSKHYIKCNVVMLDTENATNIIKDTVIGNLIVLPRIKKSELKGNTNQNLYLTSDDEIKEGYCIYENKVYKVNEVVLTNIKDHPNTYGKSKKIIATTDPKLFIKCDGHCANDDECLCAVSQIPQSFIKKYCASNGSIDSVLVEVDFNLLGQTHPFYNYTIKTNDNNEIIIAPTKTSWSREEVEQLCKSAFDGGYSYGAEKLVESKNTEDCKYTFDNWITKNL